MTLQPCGSAADRVPVKRLGLEFNWWYVPLGTFICLRGYVEWGWWYPPIIVAAGFTLAIVVSRVVRHRESS